MEKTMKHTCIVRKTMLTPKGSEIIEGIPQGKTFRGISFREDKGSNMVFATKGTSDIGRVESATLDGTEEKIDAVIEAMKADAKVKIVGLGDEPNTFVVEVSVKIPEKLSASTGTDTKAFETEIARIESEGICERSELDKRIKAMRDNRFPDELIMKILKQYRSYKKEVKIPKTIYIDPDPDRNPSVLGECALQMLIGRATIFEGDKSVGKNVAADTLAWMFGMPQYLITFNRLMTQDDIYGTKTTEIPELMKMSDKEVEDLGLNDLAVKQNIALGKQISHEWAKKSVKFEALKAKAASMQIRQEASQLTDWLADGGLMVWNEMNMAESNFFESFANPITDGTGFHIAVALWEEGAFDGIKVIAAKAADELLNVAEVSGAFVLYEEGGTVHISGRCDNSYNVQSVLEQMGGGGHRAAAGAQLKETSLQEAYDTLVGLIRGEQEKGE